MALLASSDCQAVLHEIDSVVGHPAGQSRPHTADAVARVSSGATAPRPGRGFLEIGRPPRTPCAAVRRREVPPRAQALHRAAGQTRPGDAALRKCSSAPLWYAPWPCPRPASPAPGCARRAHRGPGRGARAAAARRPPCGRGCGAPGPTTARCPGSAPTPLLPGHENKH